MVSMKVTYEGSLRCSAEHGPSGTVVETDAPTDNHGKGERFSPTDLLATATASCMLTIMGIKARPLNIDLAGTTIDLQKAMSAELPRRVVRLGIQFGLPDIADEHRAMLEEAAHSCPVALSIHPDITLDVSFAWGAI